LISPETIISHISHRAKRQSELKRTIFHESHSITKDGFGGNAWNAGREVRIVITKIRRSKAPNLAVEQSFSGKSQNRPEPYFAKNNN